MTGHPYGIAIFDQHAKLLKERAVDPEVARDRGYRSADQKAQLEREGFGPAQRQVPALVIPVWDVHGERHAGQVRPDTPRIVNGKARKYETRTGFKMMLDVPPRVRPMLGDPSVPLVITEGPIKADAAVSAGLCCVALLGVWSWRGTNDNGGKLMLPDWECVALNDRTVVVAFDSDVMLKAGVHQALARLGAVLNHRGADVAYTYLPHGDAGAKIGLDDWLAEGHAGTELFDLATPTLRTPVEVYTPQESDATAQPPPPEPPKLASDLRILDRFKVAVRGCGVVGEETTAATLYLLITSRVLDKPVSTAVKGHSSSGKSFTVEQTVKFFPDDAVIEMTAMSERALVYSKEDYQHRTIVLYEAVALREGNDDNLTSYFVRSLLSEGRIKYPVTVRDADGNFITKEVVKEGPCNLVVTTTKTQIHSENETRVLSLATDDSREQTARVLLALADENEDNGVDLDEWQKLQAWLQTANHRVTIPYATDLAEMIPPVAVRLRRDFGAVLALIRSHAILHQLTRETDELGRIVATIDDYAQVRGLVADLIAEGVGSTVSPVVRETVQAVAEIATTEGVMVRAVAEKLGLDKSTASRRLRMAADGGYVRNLEDKKGKPGRWVAGDPMPEEADLLPQPRNLSQHSDLGGCAVASDSEGESRGTESDGQHPQEREVTTW